MRRKWKIALAVIVALPLAAFTGTSCALGPDPPKLVKRRAHGYRNFRNYRLRLLNACA